VSVKVAGVNPVDTYIRSGTYARVPSLPYVPGVDGAGVVQEIGDQVSNVKVRRSINYFFFLSATALKIFENPQNLFREVKII